MLTSNIVVPPGTYGIMIQVSNVTIDLNGHSIIGPGDPYGYMGILLYGMDKCNITIKNGIVTGFRIGIYLSTICDGMQIKDMKANDNGYDGGIHCSNAIVTNCTASNNGNSGFHGANSIFTNCIANNNDQNSGFSVVNSTVTNCTAKNNHGHAGIKGSGSIITNCIASSNDNSGIYATDDSRVEANNLRANGGYGLRLSGDNNYAIKNVASGNASGNFYSYGTNYMPLAGDNANYGF